ncbi:MAG: hypothetical protein Q8P31_06810 [Bacillota bacterium]|nr:hypothetical protein [Bacillota bacterium]
MDFLAGLGAGLAAAPVVGAVLLLRGRRVRSMVVVGEGGLESLRRVGELVVLRAM